MQQFAVFMLRNQILGVLQVTVQHTYVCNVCVCLRCLYGRNCNMQLLHALEGVVKTLRERMRVLWGTCIDYTV